MTDTFTHAQGVLMDRYVQSMMQYTYSCAGSGVFAPNQSCFHMPQCSCALHSSLHAATMASVIKIDLGATAYRCVCAWIYRSPLR